MNVPLWGSKEEEGRNIVPIATLGQIRAQVGDGRLKEGDSVGVCKLDRGALLIKRSGANAQFPMAWPTPYKGI